MSDEEAPLAIHEIKNLVREMLGHDVHPNTLMFRAGVIMLSFIRVGPKAEKIAEFTGYSLKRNIVQSVLRRMEEIGIWNPKDNEIRVDWLGKYDDTEDKAEVQTIAFVMDCMTIDGHFTRSVKDGELYYQINGKAEDLVEGLPI